MSIGLRLYKVDLAQVTELLRECGDIVVNDEKVPLGAFVDPKDVRFTDPTTATVDLKVKSEYEGSKDHHLKQDVSGEVTREMLGQIWDILGLFPRAGLIPGEVDSLFTTIHNAQSLIRSIAQGPKLVNDPEWSRNALANAAEEIYSASQKLEARLKQLF